MKSLAFLLVASLLFVAPVRAAVIVQDGKPAAAIVVAPDAEQAAKAASELQTFIKKISGAELPIVTEGQATDAKVRLLVGHTAAAKKLGVTIPSGYDTSIREDAFEEEGLVVITKGNDIVIAGNEEGGYQGTMYAAYRFLNELGVRWYFPGDFGEVVPQSKTIDLPSLNITSKPDFAMRMIWISGWVPITREERATYAEFALRIGFNPESKKGFYPLVGDGFLGSLIHPNEFFEERPELYAMNKKGERHAYKHRNPSVGYYDRHTMLCMSNPDVFTLSVKNLKEAFAGERKMNIVSDNGVGISPPDGAPFCYCENCLAASQNFNYPKYVHERMQSEEVFGFASRLGREFPDKWIATMAYALREAPPEGVEIVDNMSVTVAPISSCVLHTMDDPSCWRRLEYTNMLTHWRELTPHIMIYDYNPGMLTGMWLPERDVANMAVNAKIYRDLDIKGMKREGRKAFMQTWISYYMCAKLLWDADADVEALKADFYNTFFGSEAGPHVQAWFDACEVQLATSTAHVHEDFLINHIYTTDFTDSIHKHVEAAGKATMTDAQRKRFEVFALIADHLEGYAAMCAAERKMDYAEAAKQAGRMYEDQAKLSEIDSFLMTHHKGKPRHYFVEGRKVMFEEQAAKTDGTKGTLAAAVPLKAKFKRDRYNQGMPQRWYLSDHDDSDWGEADTYYLWDQQFEPENERGNDYDGHAWYRMTVNIPADFKDKPMKLWLGGAMNEAWVWVNGKYVGHKKHMIWWHHLHDIELDVTDLIKPGEENTLTVRVFNDAELGGMYRRGFFYSPKAE